MLSQPLPRTEPSGALAPWSHLSIPRRMHRVIERRRHLLDGTVTERDFLEEPETCDLSVEELRDNYGVAKQLVDSGRPEPNYNRAERISHGAAGLLSFLPTRQDLIDRLGLFGFDFAEAAELLPEILDQAAPK